MLSGWAGRCRTEFCWRVGADLLLYQSFSQRWSCKTAEKGFSVKAVVQCRVPGHGLAGAWPNYRPLRCPQKTRYAVCHFGSRGWNVTYLCCSGYMQPQHGIELVTSPDVYPVWYNREPLWLEQPAGGAVLEYKYCVFSGGEFEV
jgi:hypothetical protein